MLHPAHVTFAGFSRDGAHVVTVTADQMVRIWDARTVTPLGVPVRGPRFARSAAFSPDGGHVVIAGDEMPWILELATSKLLETPMRHRRTVTSAEYSPDGTQIVTSSGDMTARVWDVATGHPVGEPMRHIQTVFSAAFSPDGRRIVTASLDKTARIWDAVTGKPLGEPIQHLHTVFSAAFSPDGTRIVTVAGDSVSRATNGAGPKSIGEVQLWDATTLRKVGVSMQTDGHLRSVSFSSDGMRIVTATGNSAQVWDVAVPTPSGSALLSQVAQLTSDNRLGTGGIAEPLENWRTLHKTVKLDVQARAAPHPSAAWMTWFLADHLHRTISPFSQITVTAWISNRLEENTAESVHQAWEVNPNNPRCVSRLARRLINDIPEKYAAGIPIYVDLYSRRAVELSSTDPDVLWRRVAMLAWLGRRDEAERLAERCSPPGMGDLWAWEGKWEACLMLKRHAEGEAALARARELGKGYTKYIRDSLEKNVAEVRALRERPATTGPTTLPSTQSAE